MPYDYLEMKDNLLNEDYKEAKINILDEDYGLFHKVNRQITSIEDLKEYQQEQIIENRKVADAAPISGIEVSKVSEPKAVRIEDSIEPRIIKVSEGPYETVYRFEMPKLMAAAPDAGPVRVVPVTLNDSLGGDDAARRDRIDWLFSLAGVVYRYDRGVIMIDPDGVKREEILDGTMNHHMDAIQRLARDHFGVEVVSDIGPVQRAVETIEHGLTTFMCEGSRCYIFLPAELTEAELDQIISEVEPRGEFVFLLARGEDDFTDSLTQEEVLSFLGRLKDQFKEDSKEEEDEEVLSARRSYIRDLLAYLEENHMTLNQYYTMLGEKLRNGDVSGLPEFERKNPFLTPNDIERLIDSEEERIVEYFANTMSRVIELNLDQMEELDDEDDKEKDDDEVEREVREAYIRLLMNYIKERGITLEEYYRLLAIKLRNGDVYSVPRFEEINPFLDEDDIRRLLDEQDERIVDYFAHTMARVIELNLERMNDLNNNKKPVDDDNDPDKYDDEDDYNDTKDNFGIGNTGDNPDIPEEDDSLELDEMSFLDEKTNYMSGIKITYINTDLINHMNGLAVIREPKSGRINIYGYENDDINLSGKKVIENSESKVESGYYVNLSEYVGILAHGIEDQYGKDANFAFVDEKGEYLNFYDVINNIMATCRNEGALRYGREYKDAEFNSYEELENQYTGNRGIFKGVELTKGLYVRRDILIDELNKYRVAITKENIDNISRVR